jgi:hypothetical protein
MGKLEKRSWRNLFIDLKNDPERKSFLKMIGEVLYLSILHKGFPRHYFSRFLFKKDRTNIGDFFPDNFLYYKLKHFLNNKHVNEVLENKLFFNFYYSQFDISLPEIVMFNHKKMFVAGTKCSEVNNVNELKILLEELFNNNPDCNSLIIKKTYWSYGGDKIYKFYRDEINTKAENIAELYNEVIKAGFLFQKTIKQNEQLNKLNSSSINTIRFDTFNDATGKIDIMSGYLRMSVGDTYVDNISSGGCMVGIDLETGKLKKNAYRTFRYYGVKILTEHPATKTKFENFTIPFFDQAKELVKKTAGLMPDLRLTGWDVAIGESGPILVEGNSDYDLSGNDLNFGGYRSNPVFRKMLHELHYL